VSYRFEVNRQLTTHYKGQIKLSLLKQKKSFNG